LKISALLSDYDGTLAPEDVTLESSGVPEEIGDSLLWLSSSLPIAIVTSKDHDFIRPRTPFARAWACVSGLEIVLSDGRTFAAPETGGRLLEGLKYARRHDSLGLTFELKRSTSKHLLAFSIDWRRVSTPPNTFVETTTAALTRMGLTVAYDPARPYVDVFGTRPDKGRAVRELRRLLAVSGNVLFLGDSMADNPAFEEADLAICVAHGQSLDGIRAGYVIRQEELPGFLRSFAEDRSLDLRTLRRK
jgi:hydroxymethylpyrimidine pyrophosphatase-like HAD family hydrolase